MMEGYRNFMLGNMLVLGTPSPKLAKALAVIADGLHTGFDLASDVPVNKSKESCVLAALTARDFLRQIGLDARERSSSVVMRAERGGTELHSLGVGGFEDNPREADPGYWNGHMVVLVENYLIECTLYRAVRPAWPDLPPMFALPCGEHEGERIFDKPVLATATITDDAPPGDYRFDIIWLDFRKNRGWRRGPDGRDMLRRLPVVRRLVDRFRNGWEEAA
jgi:hypothetical protein